MQLFLRVPTEHALGMRPCFSIPDGWGQNFWQQCLFGCPVRRDSGLRVHAVLDRGWLHCRVPRDDRLDVQLSPSDKEGSAGMGLGFGLQYLLNALPSVIVAGIPTVERAVINKKEDDTREALAREHA